MANENNKQDKIPGPQSIAKLSFQDILNAKMNLARMFAESGLDKLIEKVKTIDVSKINNLKDNISMHNLMLPQNNLINLSSLAARKAADEAKRDHKIIELLEQIAQNSIPIQYARITVDEIDTFFDVGKITEDQVTGIVPLQLEEKAVKEYLHEIISDPFVQKDWGGEKCDIFTSHIKFRNRKTPCAFILKGKSYARGKLVLSDLGKNGDQLLRLFQEPAELFFVQSNGYIDSSVESTMQAFITQKMKESCKVFYCLIDGIDTARILKAFGKI